MQLVEASDRQDLLARLSTSFAAGDPPDVFLINYRFYGQFAAKGVLEPLEERVESSDGVLARGLLSPAGRGVQLARSSHLSAAEHLEPRRVLQPRPVPAPRRARAAGGLDVRNDGRSRAAQLTLDANGAPVRARRPESGATGPRPAVFGLGVEPSVIRLAPFVWSGGGELVDDERRPTRFALETTGGARRRSSIPRPAQPLPGDADRSGSRGGGRRGALRQRPAGDAPLLAPLDPDASGRSTDFDWDVAPLPVLREQAGILHSDAYCMAAGSRPEGRRLALHRVRPRARRASASSRAPAAPFPR